MHPGLAAQRLDRDPRVVGEDKSRSVRAIVERFLAGVSFKRAAVFETGRQLLESRNNFD
jgi:hypothetical protein